MVLSQQPTTVRFRVLERNTKSFKENCMGECEFELMATGEQQVELREKGVLKGIVLFTIEPQF